jgi:hypothetical protein
MKFYIEILTIDGGWITYAVRDDYENAVSVRNMLEVVHKFNTYQIRIVK